MNIFLFILLSIIFVLPINAVEEDPETIKHFETYHNEVILPQLNVWKEYAGKVIPNDPNNIISDWGNTKLDSLYNQIVRNPKSSVFEQRSKLSFYQGVICSGITYPIAWMLYKTNPGFSKIGQDVYAFNNVTLDSLKNVNFYNSELVLTYETNVYGYYISYLILNAVNDNQEYEEFLPLFSENVEINKLISYFYSSNVDQYQLFFMTSVFANVSFFRTFVAMLKATGGLSLYEENQEEYAEMSRWFDAQAQKVLDPLYNGTANNIKPTSFEEFITREKQATTYKIRLMNDLISVVKNQLPVVAEEESEE